MEGWISLYRKILDNPVICKDSDYFAVWCYLLLNATHKSVETIFNKKKIRLIPGQVITGRKIIANKFKINESKVQRILKLFESEQQIEQQTSTRNRLITITNWELYQPVERQSKQQVNNKCTTNEHKQQCNNNINNNIYNQKVDKNMSEKFEILKADVKELCEKYDIPTTIKRKGENKNE